MKKILLFSLLIIFIPYIFVNIFIKEDEIKFIYHDTITVRVKRKDGRIDVVPLEEYVVGVVAGEMPLSFHDEALKAQAVAARTYVLKRIIQNKNNEYDVVDTVLNQVYLDNNYLKEVWKDNYVNNINRLKKVVLSTEGEFLTYDEEIIDALYFSTSVGLTENSKDVFGYYVPYLQNVDSSWDNISPVFEETKTFKLYEFFSKLNLTYKDYISVSVINSTATGRVKKIKINDTIFNANDIVSSLNLRSAYFTIIKNDNNVIVKTHGYGHGVGMSQYGAEAMNLKGYSYDEILKYYYKGVEIKKL